jgi:molecular chaperone GrpE
MKVNKEKKKQGNKETEEAINQEVVLLKNQLVRALADYDNLRKRTEEEKLLWIRFSTARILTSLISILDNFELAQKHLSDSGLAIAIGEFRKVFAEEGLEEINPKAGEDFDHENHEAVESIEVAETEKDGKITEVVLPGWKFKDNEGLAEGRQIIRHAKVKVFKSNKQEETSDKKEDESN